MEGKRFSGKRLRKVREREKMTQEALAYALNTEQWLISAYERGRHVPGSSVINRLTVILRCTEEDLFD